jgi:hypothetical protein
MNLEKIIKEILNLEKKRGQPFTKIRKKELRKKLTDYLLSNGIKNSIQGRYVLQIGFIKGDKNKPYTMIYTKENFKKSYYN